jgi:hypothetical protein
MSVSKQSLMCRNPKKTRNKLKTSLNEIEFCRKERETHANAATRLSSFKFKIDSVSLGDLVGKTPAPQLCRIFSLGSNPRPRNYDSPPLSPLFSFFCHIQMFFYTNMNIFIPLLENVNKSRN